MKTFWNSYSFILRGERRKKVLFCLSFPKIPKQIAQECKMSLSNVNAAIQDLKKNNLIYCLNPSQKIGRVYTLTNKGKKSIDYLNKSKKIDS